MRMSIVLLSGDTLLQLTTFQFSASDIRRCGSYNIGRHLVSDVHWSAWVCHYRGWTGTCFIDHFPMNTSIPHKMASEGVAHTSWMPSCEGNIYWSAWICQQRHFSASSGKTLRISKYRSQNCIRWCMNYTWSWSASVYHYRGRIGKWSFHIFPIHRLWWPTKANN